MKRVLLSCLALVAILSLPFDGRAQIPSIPGVSSVPGVNPDFMGSMGKALGGATPMQSAGAAGAIFKLAKTRLSPSDFARVSDVVPGMDGLLQAAPPIGAIAPTGVESLSSSSIKLGLKPDMVSKAIPIVTEYVSKSGGKDLGKMLSGVLK